MGQQKFTRPNCHEESQKGWQASARVFRAPIGAGHTLVGSCVFFGLFVAMID